MNHRRHTCPCWTALLGWSRPQNNPSPCSSLTHVLWYISTCSTSRIHHVCCQTALETMVFPVHTPCTSKCRGDALLNQHMGRCYILIWPWDDSIKHPPCYSQVLYSRLHWSSLMILCCILSVGLLLVLRTVVTDRAVATSRVILF